MRKTLKIAEIIVAALAVIRAALALSVGARRRESEIASSKSGLRPLRSFRTRHQRKIHRDAVYRESTGRQHCQYRHAVPVFAKPQRHGCECRVRVSEDVAREASGRTVVPGHRAFAIE